MEGNVIDAPPSSRDESSLLRGLLIGVAFSMAWLLPPALVGFATDFDPNGWLSESDTVFEACAWFVVAGIGIVPAAMALWGQRHQLSGGSIVLLVVASLAIFLVLAAALIVGIVALDSAINPGSGVD